MFLFVAYGSSTPKKLLHKVCPNFFKNETFRKLDLIFGQIVHNTMPIEYNEQMSGY